MIPARRSAGRPSTTATATACSSAPVQIYHISRRFPTHWLICAQVGAGFSTVRWDPESPKGIPALLAVDGAALVADGRATFRLELGEAPLAPLPTHLAEGFPPLPFVSAVTRLVYDRGRLLYNARGISAWKRKWRAEESALWICCEKDPPFLETVAALALIYDP